MLTTRENAVKCIIQVNLNTKVIMKIPGKGGPQGTIKPPSVVYNPPGSAHSEKISGSGNETINTN